MILANDKRVIVACDVHPSSETEVTPALLDRAQALLGKVETVLLDAGFFSEGIVEATEQREIELLCPEGQSVKEDWNKQSNKQFPKNRFHYQADEDSYLCPKSTMSDSPKQLQRRSKWPGLYCLRLRCVC